MLTGTREKKDCIHENKAKMSRDLVRNNASKKALEQHY